MQTKKKILIINEFSQLATGFATYMKYILPYLHNTGKYEIAEFATYINKANPMIGQVPWKVYANEPDPNNPQEQQRYQMNRANQFGLWKFDETCLEFCPDIIIDIRDPWMTLEWINKSPYRKNFKFCHMATCDGEPQKQDWVDLYKTCDRFVTYSVWAKKLLETQTNNTLKVDAVASPGVDIKEFTPMDKVANRTMFGLQPDSFIVSTVMRNQPRKLYPELFKAFALYLEKCKQEGRNDLAEKSYLYCHTSYPDVGWDLGLELHRHKISHKVLFTILCDKCGVVYPSFFPGDVSVCRRCNNITARFPNTVSGVDRNVLAKIMSCSDLYIQYSICEGWGMPINDAKALGVPVLALDYSAMTEQCYNGGALPVKVKRHFQESLHATNQLRALPDNEDCADKIFQIASNQELREKLGIEARECMVKYYDWAKIAKIWENLLDNIECDDQGDTWLAKPKLIQPNLQFPPNLNNYQFIEWIIKYVLQDPSLLNSALMEKWVAVLNLGYEVVQGENNQSQRIPMDRQKIVQQVLEAVQVKNNMEQYRYDRLVLKKTGQNNQSDLQYIEV